jgi:hypothetical protein
VRERRGPRFAGPPFSQFVGIQAAAVAQRLPRADARAPGGISQRLESQLVGDTIHQQTRCAADVAVRNARRW